MNKLWKIGTNINSYIDEIKDWSLTCLSYELKHENKQIIFVFDNGTEIEKSKSTASQFQRVLLSLGYIEANIQYFNEDKEIIREGIQFKIRKLNIGESDGDFIISNIVDRIQNIFEDNELLYPSEINFMFSLLGIFFILYDAKKYEKIINYQLENSKISDVKKWYEDVAQLLIESKLVNKLIQKSQNIIVGASEDDLDIFESVNSKISVKYKYFFANQNLENLIAPEPLTWGKFIEKYFSTTYQIWIPIYQRKYVWDKNILKILLNDINNLSNKNLSHYIGNIVLKWGELTNNNKRIVKIIDGQQRITTLALIVRALFDFSKYKNVEVDYMINTHLDIESEYSITKVFKRIEGNDDFQAFQKIIRGELKTLNRENKSKMINNYHFIVKWMNHHLNTSQKIEEFWKNILNGITLVLINDKNSNEFKLFEKLNTNSVPLTTLELFKNYVLNHFENQKSTINEKEAQNLFEKNIEGKFKSKSRNKDINEFLTAYLRSENGVLTKSSLFNQFKDTIENIFFINNPTLDLKDIIEKIGKEIDLYKSISEYEKYTDKKQSTYYFADFLYIFDRRTVYYPIFIRLLKYFTKDYNHILIEEANKIREYLRVIEIFEARFQVAKYRGQSLSSKIEMILNQFNQSTTPKELWEMLKKGEANSTSIPEIELFQEILANQPIQNKPAKLIMTRLENYFHLKNNWHLSKDDNTFVALYDKKSQREHLLPIKWEKNWKEYLQKMTNLSFAELQKETNKYIDFIGNAFPIPEWSNNQISNGGIKNKINDIRSNSFARQLILFNGIENNKFKLDKITNIFSHEEIIKRSRDIAKIATHIWADYI